MIPLIKTLNKILQKDITFIKNIYIVKKGKKQMEYNVVKQDEVGYKDFPSKTKISFCPSKKSIAICPKDSSEFDK